MYVISTITSGDVEPMYVQCGETIFGADSAIALGTIETAKMFRTIETAQKYIAKHGINIYPMFASVVDMGGQYHG